MGPPVEVRLRFTDCSVDHTFPPTIVIFFEIKDLLAAFLIGFGAGWFPAKIGTGYLFGDYD